MKLDWWKYPGTEFIGWLSLGNIKIPFEEFFFWIIIGILAVLTYFEFFDDDEK